VARDVEHPLDHRVVAITSVSDASRYIAVIFATSLDIAKHASHFARGAMVGPRWKGVPGRQGGGHMRLPVGPLQTPGIGSAHPRRRPLPANRDSIMLANLHYRSD